MEKNGVELGVGEGGRCDNRVKKDQGKGGCDEVGVCDKTLSIILFFQFGELQVELTSKKAFIGAGIGLVFG
ncbi:hypothetical protein BHM03_00029327 [Ensete ventricosum]|nr:hypothetical protein BHM03_00029327 [Ensete ventricosum]